MEVFATKTFKKIKYLHLQSSCIYLMLVKGQIDMIKCLYYEREWLGTCEH
jgi:hypothetical protein